MFGAKKLLCREEDSSKEHDRNASLTERLDFSLIRKVYHSYALISAYESATGVRVPDKYKRGL